MNWHILNQWEQWALGIGCSLAAGVIALFFKRLFGKRREVREVGVQQNTSPVLTQTFQPTINISAPVVDSRHRSQPTQMQGGDKPTASLPSFEYKGPREKAVFVSPDARDGISDPHDSDEHKHSLQCLVLRFENALHDKAAQALEVIAKISFRSSNGITHESIDYAVWLNSPCNCTDMDVGDTRELVLICEMDGALYSFDDRREANHNFYSEWSWLDRRPIDGLEFVEVRLIDKRTRATKTFTLKIWRDGAHFNVAQS